MPSMHDPLTDVLTESLVASLGGPRSFERAVAYLEDGMVGPLRASAGRVAARVQGTHGYAVELEADGQGLGFVCSCPVGSDGAFCKHCVAVALSWLRAHDAPGPTLDDARAFLDVAFGPGARRTAHRSRA
jgi:uncharacterized Zn finger protein